MMERYRHLMFAFRWISFLLMVLAIVIVWAYRHDRAPAGAPMGEAISPDEQYQTAPIVASAIQLSMQSRAQLLAAKPSDPATSKNTSPGFSESTYRRDVHAKSHGCVAAKFRVDGVHDPLNVGLFAQAAEYDAIIRFSSGKSDLEPDRPASLMPLSQTGKDARGFALKVLGVQGLKLLDYETGGTTQDFIMINSPAFFIRTIEEYAHFSAALGAGKPFSYFLPSFNPATWHLREMKLATSTFKPAPASLMVERFYSLSAYALGAQQYVKYGIRPNGSNRPMPLQANGLTQNQIDADYLRLELAAQARQGGATLDFMLQPQVPGKNMPVEDATVEWSEKDSPFVKVATLTVLKGDYNTPEWNERCENLEFNPWHALAEHRPVGVMNRVRKVLYQQMSGYRCGKNCQRYCKQQDSVCFKKCLDSCPLLVDPVPLKPELPVGTCPAAH